MKWLLPMLAVVIGGAGPPAVDPDWPCVQRLVPVLTGGTVWAGHEGGGDWRSDPAVSGLVEDVSPRGRSAEDGTAKIASFMAGVPAGARAEVASRVFAGLVEETNALRGEVIERLHEVARRQRDLTRTVSGVTSQLRALPEGAPAGEREEIVSRRGFLIRDYEEVGRTIRYACEVPVQLEARLGVFAQALQEAVAATAYTR